MRKILGRHDFSGNCDPRKSKWRYDTFSVGIFQWVEKSGGKGMKKSPVKFRVYGPTKFADVVYRQANKLCDEMDAGKFPSTKSVWV